MKNKIIIFLLFVIYYHSNCQVVNILPSLSKVKYVKCANCFDPTKTVPEVDMDDNTIYSYNTPAIEYPTLGISHDFGPRNYDDGWHGGIDYNSGGENSDRGDLVLAIEGGKVRLSANKSLKYIVIEKIPKPTTDYHEFGYLHLFRSSTTLPQRSGNCILTYMDGVNNDKIAMIRPSLTSSAATAISTSAPVGATVTHLNNTYLVTNLVQGDEIIGAMGSSTGDNNTLKGEQDDGICDKKDGTEVECAVGVHLHLSCYMNGNSSGKDGVTKNPFEFVRHDLPAFDLQFISNPSTRVQGINLTYPGSAKTSILASVKLIGQSIYATRYPVANDLNDVKIMIKKANENDDYFNYITGTFKKSYFSFGGTIGTTHTYNTTSISTLKTSLSRTCYSPIGIGKKFNNGSLITTGIKPFCYNSHPWDDFYFSDFLTRLHKEDDNESNTSNKIADNPQNTLYNDGSYDLRVESVSVLNDEKKGNNSNIIIDNFIPFIRQAVIKFQNLNYNSYDRQWVAEEKDLTNKNGDDGYVYKKSTNYCVPQTIYEKDLGAINITAYASEEMENLDLEIYGTTNGKIKGILTDPSKYEWKFTIQNYFQLNSSNKNNEFELRFYGKDKSGNQILNMEEYQGNVANNNTVFQKNLKVYIPKRQQVGTPSCTNCWSPVLIAGFPKTDVDYFHKLNLDPLKCGKFLTDEDTERKSGGVCIKSLDDITVNTTISTGTNGTITLTFPANTGGYAIRWLQNGVVLPQYNDLINISNLAPGTYCFEIVCECCKFDDCIEVPACPSLLKDHVQTNPSCTNKSDGSITIKDLYGTAPYTFAWSTGQTTASLFGLKSGTYQVTISDADGCKSNHSFVLQDPIDIKATVKNICSAGEKGSIILTITDNRPAGASPIIYIWEKFVNGQWVYFAGYKDLTDLSEGKYRLSTTDDADECYIQIGEYEVKKNVAPNISFQYIIPINCDSKLDKFEMLVLNTTPPYEYEVYKDDKLLVNGQSKYNNVNFSNLELGKYKFIVKLNGCEYVKDYEIICCGNKSSFEITPVIKSESVNGAKDGSIELDFPELKNLGTTQHLKYNWSTGAKSKDLYNLAAGYYCVSISNVDCGLIKTQCFEVNKCFDVTYKISRPCKDEKNGRIVLSVEGNNSISQPVTYLWSNGETSSSLSNVGIGNYSVTISNENCKVIKNIRVDEAIYRSLWTYASVIYPCDGKANGQIKMNIPDNIDYNILWSNGSTENAITNLTQGHYNYTVTEGNCMPVSDYAALFPIQISESWYPDMCDFEKNTYFSINYNKFDKETTIEWSTGATNVNEIPLTMPGTYSVTITQSNGCVLTASKSFVGNIPLIIPKITAPCDDQVNNGVICLEDVEKIGYNYLWSNGTTDNCVKGLLAGEKVSVTITHPNKTCSKIMDFIIEPLNDKNIIVTHKPCASKTNIVEVLGLNTDECRYTLSLDGWPIIEDWDGSKTEVSTEYLDGTLRLETSCCGGIRIFEKKGRV